MISFARHSRARLILFWSLFALAAVLTAVAVWGLGTLLQAELKEQQRRVLADETARAAARARDWVDQVRLSTIAELAGLHTDGLARSLLRWDEGNDAVTGTFEWDPDRGFAASSSPFAADGVLDSLPALWKTFGTWRESHRAAAECDLQDIGPWRVLHVRTTDPHVLGTRELKYQAENLEILLYARRVVDPWAGWAARGDDPEAPWVVWYRAGPDAPVRGCFLDTRRLLADLAAQFADTALAHVALVPRGKPVGAEGASELVEGFPALHFAVSPGNVLADRQSRVRLTLLVVVLLTSLFVVGAGMLGIYSRREARDAERKTTFVSQVSHELRTPLTSIRMFADMLSAPTIPDEKRVKFAGTISRESQRLAGLIERLLTFNALERGKSAVRIGPVDVGALVRETLDEQEGVLRDTGLALERSVPDGAVVVATDRSALKQALLNLLDNATKYASEGGRVHVTVEDTTSHVVVRVSDRGPGIPARLRRHIFEPFVQGGQTLTDKAPGLGLGLSIARGLLRHAGADLVLASADDGAVFEIRLPISPTP